MKNLSVTIFFMLCFALVACQEQVLGSLKVNIIGLPSGINASIKVNDQAEIFTSGKIFKLPVGLHTITADKVVDGDTTFTPTVTGSPAQVTEKTTTIVTVDYKSLQQGIPAKNPSGITVELNSLIYKDQSEVSLVLDFHSVSIPEKNYGVVLSASISKDVEYVELKAFGGSRFGSAKTIPVQRNDGQVKPGDDKLSLSPNETFYALYFVDKSQVALANVEESITADFGIMERLEASASAPVRVEPSLLGASLDETNPPAGAKAVGTLLRKDDLPIQIATRELIFYPKDDEQLKVFLEHSKGKIRSEQAILDETQPGRKRYLIEVDPNLGDVQHLEQIRELFGEKGDLLASKSEALGIYALVMQYRLEGFVVGVNPKLQSHAAPSVNDPSATTQSMKMLPRKNLDVCVPGDPDRPCVQNVPAVWSYLALFGKDQARINAAAIDDGFAPNADFRRPIGGAPWVECNQSNCGPGYAESPPQVGAGLFGSLVWHGTGVVSIMGGIVNNNQWAAGVGGQVVVPMMFDSDLGTYAFEIGESIKLAVDKGASCINISVGYPCSILTNIGLDFDICSVEGRVGLCSVISAAATLAASGVCAAAQVLNAIPFAGPFLVASACGAAFSTVIVATTACVSTFALGNTRSSMAEGVNYAISRGVPVIASAGNKINSESLPEVLRPVVNTSENRLDRWKVIPAFLPGVIAVGAVDDDLNNSQFFGDRVDVWAPEFSNYASPRDVHDINSAVIEQGFGGTSAAAPYITGLVAAMQAVNPSLDPNTPGLSAAQRGTIVSRIRALLVSTAFTNQQLFDMGYSNQPVERPRLVNPLAAVQAAARGILPDLAALGFDQSLNFSEAVPGNENDVPEKAKALIPNQTAIGTVLQIPNANSVPTIRDRDWFSLGFPTSASNRLFRSIVTLQFVGQGASISSPDATVINTNTQSGENTYTLTSSPSSNKRFYVSGTAAYKMTATTPTILQPVVRINGISSGEIPVYCKLAPITFTAVASYPDLGLSVSGDSITWSIDDGVIMSSGASFTHIFDTVGTYRVIASAFGDQNGNGYTQTIKVIECTNLPPTAFISHPTVDTTNGEFDQGSTPIYDPIKGLSYQNVFLDGSATDPEDGVLTGSHFQWSTNRSDLQTPDLGTGTGLIVRLYYESCTTMNHTITLRVTDNNGNITTRQRLISFYLLC
jgi:Subtilase family